MPFLSLCFAVYSCEHKVNCQREFEIFNESWDEIVESTYRDHQYKATYIVETTSGKKINISPVQHIIHLAESGDRIVKEAHSFRTLLIKKIEKDTFDCRLTSVTCDSIVLKKIK